MDSDCMMLSNVHPHEELAGQECIAPLRSVTNNQECLGALDSMDFRRLTAQRQHAVHEFWERYFAATDLKARIR
jgi:hypothetical protein